MTRVSRRPEVPGSAARRRVVDRIQHSVVDPLDELAVRLGVPPRERARLLGRGNRWLRLRLQASMALATDPVTVRIDLDPR